MSIVYIDSEPDNLQQLVFFCLLLLHHDFAFVMTELTCVVNGSKQLTVECDVLNAVIPELSCTYDTNAGEVTVSC